MVTENGAAMRDRPDENGFVDDQDRIEYVRQHLLAVHRARESGVPVDGYVVWSLLDSEVLVHVSLPELEPFEVDVDPDAAAVDEDSIEPMVRRFIARLDGETSVLPGDTIELAVAADHAHWFDPASGDAITDGSSGSRPGPPDAATGELAGLVLSGGERDQA